jgi:hypothetical protein
MATMSLLSASSAVAARPVYRIDHVTDGDTVVLGNARRVRIVQIDTPEVFFGREQPPDERGWRAYLTTDEDEPAEAVVYCPECATREFGERRTGRSPRQS